MQTHLLASSTRKTGLAALQVRQSELEGPLQERQVNSQGVQTSVVEFLNVPDKQTQSLLWRLVK